MKSQPHLKSNYAILHGKCEYPRLKGQQQKGDSHQERKDGFSGKRMRHSVNRPEQVDGKNGKHHVMEGRNNLRVIAEILSFTHEVTSRAERNKNVECGRILTHGHRET